MLYVCILLVLPFLCSSTNIDYLVHVVEQGNVLNFSAISYLPVDIGTCSSLCHGVVHCNVVTSRYLA